MEIVVNVAPPSIEFHATPDELAAVSAELHVRLSNLLQEIVAHLHAGSKAP